MSSATPAAASQPVTPRKKNYFTPKRIARVSILVALSAVGAFIKLPSPTGTVALDSAPAFVAAAAFGPLEGSIVGVLGHMFSALITGFPLGLPVHILVALATFVWVGAFGYVARKTNIWVAIPVGIILNGVGGAALLIPIYGIGIFASLLLPLVIGSAINIVIAVAVVKVLDLTGLSGTPRKGKKSEKLQAPVSPEEQAKSA
ncbi:ECF transporter S component [Salinibacterium amurskyense]|uniref:ECF transporter S component n=1 Tax=Salinibacterium amurskyense TaxID=205941 RepID=UPI00311E9812